MGRPRGGKAKRTTSQAMKNEDTDAISSDEEAVIPANKRRGRPQKHIKTDTDEEEDDAKAEEDSDAAKPIVPSKGAASVENGGKKKRRRQPKRGGDSVAAEKDKPARQNGFRQHGSRRKNTPRRAAEAGVDSK